MEIPCNGDLDNGVAKRVLTFFDLGFVGHACDVGANDGVFNSNTILLEKAGWAVLCVEPNPKLVILGTANRLLWREVACSDKDSDDGRFASFEGHPTYASSSSLIRDKPSDGRSDDDIDKVVVRRLDRVLDEAGFHRLDLLSVDVEGWEKEVMGGFTVDRWRPKVIILEELTENAIQIPGYTIIEKRAYDNIYLRDSE